MCFSVLVIYLSVDMSARVCRVCVMDFMLTQSWSRPVLLSKRMGLCLNVGLEASEVLSELL